MEYPAGGNFRHRGGDLRFFDGRVQLREAQTSAQKFLAALFNERHDGALRGADDAAVQGVHGSQYVRYAVAFDPARAFREYLDDVLSHPDHNEKEYLLEHFIR